MAIDRDLMREPWRRRVTGIGWRWRTAVVLLVSIAIASLITYVCTTGPVQLATSAALRATLTALVLAVVGKQVVQAVRDLRAYEWARWRRFTWLQYVALAAAVLITLLSGYGVLVFLYPALRSSPMTSVAVAIAIILLVLALALLALTILVPLVVLLLLPVLIVRALSRERRRRYYRFPAQ